MCSATSGETLLLFAPDRYAEHLTSVMRRLSDLRCRRRNNLAVMSKCSLAPVDEWKYSACAPASHPSTTAFDYEYMLLFLGCCEKLQACPRVLINESRSACKVPALGDTL